MFFILKLNKIKILHFVILFISIGLLPLLSLTVNKKTNQILIKNSNSKKIKKVKFIDLSNDKFISMEIQDFLYGALAAEMPVSFGLEALKAQTVAIYTYLLNKTDFLKNTISINSKNGNDGIVNFCFDNEEIRRKKWGKNFDSYEKKIREAVNSVLYEYLEYNGKPALTLFFSSCYKKTNSCKSVFGTDYPYLQSVDSCEFDEHCIKDSFFDCKRVKSKEVKSTMIDYFKDKKIEEKLSKTSPNSWFSDAKVSDYGNVEYINFAGNKINGQKLRFLFHLRSSNIQISYNKSSDEFIFNTKGFGHGVGMSQFGCNAMSKLGFSYQSILSHFFRA